MTTNSLAPHVTDFSTSPRGELLDALIEAVVLPPDPPARAATLSSLVYEMCLAVEWLHVIDTTPDQAADAEVLSVRRLAEAVEDHQARMNCLGADRTGPS